MTGSDSVKDENLFIYAVKVFLAVGGLGIIVIALGFLYLTESNNAPKPTQNTTNSKTYSSSNSNSYYSEGDNYDSSIDSRYSDYDYDYGYDYDYDTSYDNYEESCNIKGNISYNTGERIYHIPGQAYYDQTTINEAYGEYWFCSEEEAEIAGWRKSYR